MNVREQANAAILPQFSVAAATLDFFPAYYNITKCVSLNKSIILYTLGLKDLHYIMCVLLFCVLSLCVCLKENNRW